MVRLLVKGTRYPDCFVIERRVEDVCEYAEHDDKDNNNKTKATTTTTTTAAVTSAPAGEDNGGRTLPEIVCHIQNVRHQLQLMLLSARALADDVRGKSDADVTGTATDADTVTMTSAQTQEQEQQQQHSPPPPSSAELSSEMRQRVSDYEAYAAQLQQRLKDTRTPVRSDDEFDVAMRELRARTAALLPQLCTHVDGVDAAVAALHARYNDPDLDERTRLRVYHCRALLDTQWRSEERLLPLHTAGLWFSGKLLRGRLGDVCDNKERSTITVKVAPRAGAAPSAEPRMDYDAQRAMYAHMRAKRSALAQLAEAELHARVLQQTRARVVLPVHQDAASSGGAGGGGNSGNTTSGAATTTAMTTGGGALHIRMTVPRLRTTTSDAVAAASAAEAALQHTTTEPNDDSSDTTRVQAQAV